MRCQAAGTSGAGKGTASLVALQCRIAAELRRVRVSELMRRPEEPSGAVASRWREPSAREEVPSPGRGVEGGARFRICVHSLSSSAEVAEVRALPRDFGRPPDPGSGRRFTSGSRPSPRKSAPAKVIRGEPTSPEVNGYKFEKRHPPAGTRAPGAFDPSVRRRRLRFGRVHGSGTARPSTPATRGPPLQRRGRAGRRSSFTLSLPAHARGGGAAG